MAKPNHIGMAVVVVVILIGCAALTLLAVANIFGCIK